VASYLDALGIAVIKAAR